MQAAGFFLPCGCSQQLLEPDAASRETCGIPGAQEEFDEDHAKRAAARKPTRFGVIRTKTLGAVPMTEQAVWGVGSAWKPRAPTQ